MRWWDYLFAGLLVILFVIWCFRSMQKGYDQDEEDNKRIPPVPESLLSESYSQFDRQQSDDTPAQPVTLQDLGTAPPGR